MFTPSRDQARQFFFDTWRKYRQKEILSGMEAMALEVILEHPEYHRVLDDPERYLDRDYAPEMGETNPFLHMSMHLAIAEQLSIDQPVGIREHFRKLAEKTGSRHDAMHETMDCLAEMIWQAQRQGTTPDPLVYFDCLEKKSGRRVD
ncbi:MAG: DUF1841 family protein [Betaproteobacteria bacterium]|nr:DUF1841 family protein [Betaproteobacteria bacterium]